MPLKDPADVFASLALHMIDNFCQNSGVVRRDATLRTASRWG
jgi:hypothetical protein